MSWSRFDDRVAFHRKTLDAGNEAFGAWARMVIHANAQGSDGRLTRTEALTIAKRESVIARLLEVVLIEPHPSGGFVIHDFADWNPSAAEVSERREEIRLKRIDAGCKGGRPRNDSFLLKSKKANVKQTETKCEKQTESPLLSSPDLKISEIPLTPLPVELPTKPVAATVPDLPPVLTAEQRYARAWAAGVARGANVANFAEPVGRECGYLNRTIQAHAKDDAGRALRGGALLLWLERKGEEFGQRVDPRYGGLKAMRFFEWVNAGCKSENDRPSGTWKARPQRLIQREVEGWDSCPGLEVVAGDDLSPEEFEKNLSEMRKVCSPRDVANYERQRAFLTGTG